MNADKMRVARHFPDPVEGHLSVDHSDSVWGPLQAFPIGVHLRSSAVASNRHG
jgi:hypothetical protein